jgi:hypothetical protein
MIWTVIVVFRGDDPDVNGSFSHSFSFIGSHDRRQAFTEASSRLEEDYLDVIAIIPGEHPVYHPDVE